MFWLRRVNHCARTSNRRMLLCAMTAEPDKPKPDDEARAREKESTADDKDALARSREKIPEGEGNLRRRADWFQKRTGQTP